MSRRMPATGSTHLCFVIHSELCFCGPLTLHISTIRKYQPVLGLVWVLMYQDKLYTKAAFGSIVSCGPLFDFVV